MKNSITLSAFLGLFALILLSGCAKKASTPDQAIAHAQETHATMKKRYHKVLAEKAMSPECIQELRVLGVYRERTAFEIFYDILFLNWFSWNSRKSTPIFRMEAILNNDLKEMSHALSGLRRFGLEKLTVCTQLTQIHAQLSAIKEQLPVQKEYIDENNTRITHSMLTTLQLKR